VVRKKLGLTLVSEKTGEERVYRVIVSDIPLKRKSRGHSRSVLDEGALIGSRLKFCWHFPFPVAQPRDARAL
jgi:hypothetical protein